MTNIDVKAAASEDEVEQQEYEEPGQLYVRGIKFFGGDEIVCAVLADDIDWTMKKFISIIDPMKFENGHFVPFFATSDQSATEIPTMNILAMFEVHDSMMTKYEEDGNAYVVKLLREDLKNPDLTDEEREEIERDIFQMTDADEPIELPEPPEMFRFLEVPTTLQ